jgi:ERCC4-type nuclease
VGRKKVQSLDRPLIIMIDTREQRPPPFPDGVTLERVTMDAGDYTTAACQGIAVIERKSLADFANSITHDRERFEDEIRRLQGYRWKCCVVEGDLTSLYLGRDIHIHSVLGTLASFQARHDFPVHFAGSAPWAGRLIAGILRRWDERLTQSVEREASI